MGAKLSKIHRKQGQGMPSLWQATPSLGQEAPSLGQETFSLDWLKQSQWKSEPLRFLLEANCRNASTDTPRNPEARLEILTTIKEWANDVSEGSQNVFWMTGDSGIGKSAIAASFARECKDSKIFCTQFLVNKNHESTTNPRFYFPLIACQIAEQIVDLSVISAIHDILLKKASLFDKQSAEQALDTFVEVFQVICDLDRSKPVVIIFDDLDETSREHLENTAAMFSMLSTKLKRRNAKVFTSNRTNNEITTTFYRSLPRDWKLAKHLHLDTAGSRKDVEVYLKHNFEFLIDKWALVWKERPREVQFQKLCDQADGLFIWAVTVVKFVRGQLEEHGPARWHKILDMFNEDGMRDLNTLYGTILAVTFGSDAEYERFRWVVGFIIGLKEPLTIGALSRLLDLPDSDPVDIPRFVTKLKMVLVGGTEIVDNNMIPRLHKTFIEYVTSNGADPQFRIDVPMVDGQIVTKCLRLVARLRNGRERDLIPAESVRYATNWTRHIPCDAKSGIGVIGGGDVEGLRKILSTTAALSKGSMSVSGDYRTHMYDPRIGLPPRPIGAARYIHSSTIIGLNCRAIAVSSDGQLIASGDEVGVVQLLDSRTQVPIWKSGTDGAAPITCVCFSPDSRWLVSGSWDGTLRMWDCVTGGVTGPPLSGNDDSPYCVLTDGQRIISVTFFGMISVWSCDTRQLIGTPIRTYHVPDGAALSEDGRVAVVLGDVRIFNIEPLQEIASMERHGGRGPLSGVAFSPDGSRIASGDWNGRIHIWNVRTGKQTQELAEHTRNVSSVAFSPDGSWIASASYDKTVGVWNSETGEPVGLPLRGHTGGVTFITFSTDGCQIISGSTDDTVRIWSPLRKWPKVSQKITAIELSRHPATSLDDRISLQGHPLVISACCSHDRSLYAASTSDGRVSIWNGERKLLWETYTSIHPIHLLRLSDTQLILSTPDGSISSWNLNDGKAMHEEPIHCEPQLDMINLCRPTSPAGDISWLPFSRDAGLWAYVDGCFIRFEGEERSVTILELGN